MEGEIKKLTDIKPSADSLAEMNFVLEENITDLCEYSSLALAFLGDSVYELMVREYLISQGLTRVNQLHRETVKYVNARTQSEVLHKIMDSLSSEEADIVRRGRNAKSRIPKNVEMIQYHFSTAFECLIGYLYLQHRWERLRQIFDEAVQFVEIEKTSV